MGLILSEDLFVAEKARRELAHLPRKAKLQGMTNDEDGEPEKPIAPVRINTIKAGRYFGVDIVEDDKTRYFIDLCSPKGGAKKFRKDDPDAIAHEATPDEEDIVVGAFRKDVQKVFEGVRWNNYPEPSDTVH